MSKGKSIFTIALIVICTVVFGIMDVTGFGKNGAGSAKEINLGLDLAGADLDGVLLLVTHSRPPGIISV